jgi:hypothetical protein
MLTRILSYHMVTALLFLPSGLNAQDYHPEYGAFDYVSAQELFWESPQGTQQWIYQETSEGYRIWRQKDQNLLWAWPEEGGRSYLFQGGQWFPFILLEKSTPDSSSHSLTDQESLQ